MCFLSVYMEFISSHLFKNNLLFIFRWLSSIFVKFSFGWWKLLFGSATKQTSSVIITYPFLVANHFSFEIQVVSIVQRMVVDISRQLFLWLSVNSLLGLLLQNYDRSRDLPQYLAWFWTSTDAFNGSLSNVGGGMVRLRGRYCRHETFGTYCAFVHTSLVPYLVDISSGLRGTPAQFQLVKANLMKIAFRHQKIKTKLFFD